MVSILSIDGVGIRGIIPAAFLLELESRLGQPVSSLFDLIAGTSTGGILAAMLSLPDRYGNPMYTAKETLDAYLSHSGAIFQQSGLRAITTLGGLRRPLYSPRALETMLQQYLGSTRLHQTLTEILLTAYDMGTGTPWFFKTSFAKRNRSPIDDPLLSQAVRATTAAPTYFPPANLGEHCLVDGGVFASNPAVCAYAQARNMYPRENMFLLVSLGTGLQDHERACSHVANWGIADWAVPISGVMLNAASATVHYQMNALLGAGSYFRLQTRLPEAASAMDDASDENLKRLTAIANEAVRELSPEFDRICTALKKGHPASCVSR